MLASYRSILPPVLIFILLFVPLSFPLSYSLISALYISSLRPLTIFLNSFLAYLKCTLRKMLYKHAQHPLFLSEKHLS